jgi:hypothetical protein
VIRQAQRPFGADETTFSGSSVAVQYLVAGQSAVSQRKCSAVEVVVRERWSSLKLRDLFLGGLIAAFWSPPSRLS